MATATPIEDQVRDLLGTRLRELDDERGRVEKAIAALATNGHRPRPAARPAQAAEAPTRRTRRGGTRREQAIKLVEKAGEAGISGGDIAQKMKIKANYIYRVMGDLEKEGLVRKEGRRYFPTS